MDTLSPAHPCLHATLRLTTTQGTEFVDLTDRLAALLERTALDVGTLTIQTTHTTSAIVVNEHEPLLLADFEALLDRLAPRALPYWHDELALRPAVAATEPRNGHAHCRALLCPSSAVITFAGGQLGLGRWQRVFFAEFDGPREREVSVVIIGSIDGREVPA